MIQGAARYARARAETASPDQVLLLLLREARLSMTRAVRNLHEGKRADVHRDIDRASGIVAELVSSLNHARAPELCANLSATYEFVLARLVAASSGRNVSSLEEALRVFCPVAEAFEQVLAPGGAR
ncbi:MAG: flagellar protein FliS [Deltaproteobacteria bacterium]|nr:flagellar protein FliS [Deltaproteobacteria bacterium]